MSQAGCLGPKRTPALDRIFAEARERKGKTPIVVIPGILGSELVDLQTGQVAWPTGARSLAATLPLPLSPDLPANRDNLSPGKIVASVKLARLVPEVYVYRGLLDALQRYGGYVEGDWTTPAVEGDRDTYYVFTYDWRRDNVESARELMRRLEDLKGKLKRPDLKFNIVAHSMGGLVARYAAMYGDADLPPPETSAPLPNWAGAAHINRIVMFGVPNEGSADAFATLLRGYSLTEGLRPQIRLFNTLSKEIAFSSPAVFQLLPHASVSRFLDENFKPLAVNLYDVATWKLYHWEGSSGSARDDRAPPGPESTAGSGPSEREKYLAAVLQRAKRFHEALDTPTGASAPVALLSFGGDCEETLDAPVLLRDRKKDRWITLTTPESFRTSDGRRVGKSAAIAAMYLPGDGRVTRRSLLGEGLRSDHPGPLFNTGLPIAYAVFGCDLHGNLQNNPTLQDNALTALISEVLR